MATASAHAGGCTVRQVKDACVDGASPSSHDHAKPSIDVEAMAYACGYKVTLVYCLSLDLIMTHILEEKRYCIPYFHLKNTNIYSYAYSLTFSQNNPCWCHASLVTLLMSNISTFEPNLSDSRTPP